MNLSYFISKRITSEQGGTFSSIIHKVAVVTITVGLAAAIISFLIMTGFQETIKNKIYGFSSHLRITKLTTSNSIEEQPFEYNIDLYKNPEEFPMISHIQEYAHKPGLIKTDDEVMGVFIKGVGKSFDQEGFNSNMLEGRFIDFPDSGYSHEIVISKIIAGKINTKVDDDIIVHFFQDPPRFRRLKVVGLYETNLSEYYDSKVIIGDLRMIQRLNGWADSVAGGLEVFVDVNKFDRWTLFKEYVADTRDMLEMSDLNWFERNAELLAAINAFSFDEAAMEKAHLLIGQDMDYDHNIEKLSDTYFQLFDWLRLISRQVFILLVIILIAVCLNMVSVVIILVMERTQMIGMLKALGATNKVVRSIFIYNGVNLIIRGLLYGNFLGLGVCYLQEKFHIIKLNPHDYYMDRVPIGWNWEAVIFLNALIFVLVTIVLLIPTGVISRINPLRAIRFD